MPGRDERGHRAAAEETENRDARDANPGRGRAGRDEAQDFSAQVERRARVRASRLERREEGRGRAREERSGGDSG